MDSCTSVLKKYQIFFQQHRSQEQHIFFAGGNTVHGINVTFQFANSSFGFHEICHFKSVSVRPGALLKGLVSTRGKMLGGPCK